MAPSLGDPEEQASHGLPSAPRLAGGLKEVLHLHGLLRLQGLPHSCLPSQRVSPITGMTRSFSENVCVVSESGLLSKNVSLSPGVQENRALLFYGQENINEK